MARVTTLRTYVLTERKTAECRFTPADVDFLLAEHRAHVRLIPTGQRGLYRVTPTGYVGSIVGPGCRLLLRPKIPLGNLFHLLDPAGDFPIADDRAAAQTGSEVLDFLAGRLARLLTERAAAGLHRAYAEQTSSGTFLQGRLDVPAQLRAGNGCKDRLHCRFEEFTTDIPCNQVPRATAELVLRYPHLSAPVRAALRQALISFDQVRSIALSPDSFQGAAPDRLAQVYQPLLELCWLLAESLGPGGETGTDSCPSFLLDMERVFERYVTDGLVSAFRGDDNHTVSVQPLHLASPSVPGQPDLRMRPDVTIDRADRPVVVIDAKWKVKPGSTEDLYQVLAYGTALGARRGILVYPGRGDKVRRYPLSQASFSLEIRTLRVVGSRQACAISLDRLGQAVRPTHVSRPRGPNGRET